MKLSKPRCDVTKRVCSSRFTKKSVDVDFKSVGIRSGPHSVVQLSLTAT